MLFYLKPCHHVTSDNLLAFELDYKTINRHYQRSCNLACDTSEDVPCNECSSELFITQFFCTLKDILHQL